MLTPCFYMQVLIKKERQEVSALEQAPAGAPAGVKCYKATFKPAIKKGSSQEFDVVATITGAFTPNPAKIEQTDRQFVEYRDNLFLLSPYVVESQTTVVSVKADAAAVRLLLPAATDFWHPAHRCCPFLLWCAALKLQYSGSVMQWHDLRLQPPHQTPTCWFS
jgi:hypothetical protein